MSKFYGTVIGDRQETAATRRGFHSIKVAAQSWDGSVITRLTYEGGNLMAEIQHSDTSNTYGKCLFYGTVADLINKLKGDQA